MKITLHLHVLRALKNPLSVRATEIMKQHKVNPRHLIFLWLSLQLFSQVIQSCQATESVFSIITEHLGLNELLNVL